MNSANSRPVRSTSRGDTPSTGGCIDRSGMPTPRRERAGTEALYHEADLVHVCGQHDFAAGLIGVTAFDGYGVADFVCASFIDEAPPLGQHLGANLCLVTGEARGLREFFQECVNVH